MSITCCELSSSVACKLPLRQCVILMDAVFLCLELKQIITESRDGDKDSAFR